MKITLHVCGGGDTYYELGLLSGLIPRKIHVDFIGSDHVKDAQILKNGNVTFHNLRGDQNPGKPLRVKVTRLLKFYYRLVRYAFETDAKLFHIQWLPKFSFFDRTALILYYKLMGKKLVFTAHNVNAAERDERDGVMNRMTLKFLYKNMDHIIAHTDKMKIQLIEDFHVCESKVTVIPYGINDMVRLTPLSRGQARERLNIKQYDKTILFFGIIAPYKGLEHLISALANIKARQKDSYTLIIAGKRDKGYRQYWENIQRAIVENDLLEWIIQKIEYIPDDQVEIYMKSADVMILPYKHIFQSGVLFTAYHFGLPVIATDVGSLKEFVVEGETGFICRPEDPEDLAAKIELFFQSELYMSRESGRENIIRHAHDKYSWEKIGEKTHGVYERVLKS